MDVGEGADSSNRSSDALHGLMWDVRTLKRSGSRKIMSDSLVEVRESFDSYEELEVSPMIDSWV